MAIGRTFQESIQKALRGLETGLTGFDEIEIPGVEGEDDPPRSAPSVKRALGIPTPDRLRADRPGVPPRAHGRRDRRGLQPMSRGSCARSKRSCRPKPRCARRGLPEDAAAVPPTQGQGLLRQTPRPHRGPDRGKGRARQAPRAGRAAGVQAHRHLRSRVRRRHGLYVFNLRDRRARPGAGVRSATVGPQEGDDPRRRPQPHRPGYRVRLLLLPRGLRARSRSASSRSWSTATPRRFPPTTTRPTGSISSRSPPRTCSS